MPPYPDAGVKYAGYSKTIKGNSWKINKQQSVACNVFFNSATASSYNLFSPPSGKAFYLTDLYIHPSTGGTNIIYLTDGPLTTVNSVLQQYYVATNPVVLHFDVPIRFETSATFTILVAGAYQLYLNGVGFFEDE